MPDLIIRSTGKKAELRFVAIDLSETVNEIIKLQESAQFVKNVYNKAIQ